MCLGKKRVMCSIMMFVAIVMILSFINLISVNAATNWVPNVWYNTGDQVTYNGTLYNCVQGHTSLSGWEPPNVPSLWNVSGSGGTTPTNLSTSTPTPTRTSTSTPAGNGVIFYQDVDYNGAATSAIPPGTYSLSQLQSYGFVNDWASSCKTKGFTVILYADDYSSGTSWTLTGDTANFGNLSPGANDLVTSVKVQTGGSGPTPTATVTPSPSLRSGITWGQKVYAPYVDITFPTPLSINDCYNKTTQRYYTLAFINADSNGNAAWAGRSELSIDTNYYMTEINNIRGKAGDVIISFGGVSNTELARHWANSNVSALQSKYQAVITKYKLTWADFNIENSSDVTDRASIDLRNKAIKGLQTANPGLVVSYCLAVLPSGLTSDGQYIIQNAKDNGVRVDVVNVMTMNFGDYYAPNPNGQMGNYSNQAAASVHNQLIGMGLSSTKVGITPMIGRNDTASEIFYQADAQTVLTYAQNNYSWIREVSIWASTRDNGSGGVQPPPASPYYSSISQSEFEFTNIFKAFK